MEKLINRLIEIYAIYQEHKEYYQSNETATRDQLINPILNELGWNTASPKFVRPNQKNEAGDIPDYTLLKNDKKALIVEAKKTSVKINGAKDGSNKILPQLTKYVYDEGVEFGVLTNGLQWLLFNTFERNPTERQVWVANLEVPQSDLAEEAEKLATLAFANIDKLAENTQQLKNKQLLGGFWKTHLSSEELRLRFLAESIQQHFPKIEITHILAFLSEQNADNKPLPTVTPITVAAPKAPAVATTRKNIIPNKKPKTKGITKSGRPYAPKSPKVNIKVSFPDGSVFFDKQASETLTRVIEKAGAERVAQLGLRQNGHPFVSKEKSDTVNQYDAGNGYWVVVHSSTKDKIKQLETISKALALQLKIETV